MVRITFKTLQQKQFFIEAEPTETVRRFHPRLEIADTPPLTMVVLISNTGRRPQEED